MKNVWRRSSGHLPYLLARVQAPVWIILVLVLCTYVCSVSLGSYNLFIYNTFMLAGMGAVALNLLMGTAGQVSVGTSGFLAVGAFITAWCQRSGLGFGLALLISGLAAAFCGAIVALPAMRLRGLALGLGSIAAYYVIEFAVQEYQDATPGAGDSGFTLAPIFSGNDIAAIQQQWAWVLTGFLTVTIIVVARLSIGQNGRALRIIRDHEPIAGALGIRVFSSKVMVFAVTSFIIGVEGSLMAFISGQVTSDTFTLTLAVQYLAMVLIGGLDSIFGALIGAALITVLPFLVNGVIRDTLGDSSAAYNGAHYGQIVYGLLVLLFIVLGRDGIAGLLRSSAARVHMAVIRGPGARPGDGPRRRRQLAYESELAGDSSVVANGMQRGFEGE